MEVLIIISAVVLCFYSLLILGFAIGFNRKQISADDTQMVFVSIIVPARNEEQNIGNVLQDLLAQDYPKSKFEVLVVNDHSNDRTVEIISESENKFQKLRVLSLSEMSFGKKAALELGVSEAVGELIITLDADCRVGEKWLSGFASEYFNSDPDLIIGAVKMNAGQGIFQKFQALESATLVASGAGAARIGFPVMCNGANLGISKRVFSRDKDLFRKEIVSGDDIFLLEKVKRAGGKIVFLKNADSFAITEPFNSVYDFMNQRVRWVSKGKHYRDIHMIITGTIVLLVNLVGAVSAAISLFGYKYLLIFTGFFLIKTAVEMPLMVPYLKWSEQTRLSSFYPLVQLLNLPFTIGAFLLGIFVSYEWKGREFKGSTKEIK